MNNLDRKENHEEHGFVSGSRSPSNNSSIPIDTVLPKQERNQHQMPDGYIARISHVKNNLGNTGHLLKIKYYCRPNEIDINLTNRGRQLNNNDHVKVSLIKRSVIQDTNSQLPNLAPHSRERRTTPNTLSTSRYKKAMSSTVHRNLIKEETTKVALQPKAKRVNPVAVVTVKRHPESKIKSMTSKSVVKKLVLSNALIPRENQKLSSSVKDNMITEVRKHHQ